MRRNFTLPILDLDGKPIANPQASGAHYTLKDVAVSALMASYEDERAMSGAEKAERFALALRINASPAQADLTVEQLALLKTLIGKGFGPLVVGRAYTMLEHEPLHSVDAGGP